MSRAQINDLSSHWRIAAIGSIAIVAASALRNLIEPGGIDFIAFWAAAKLALASDPSAAYDLVVHRRVEEDAAIFLGQMPFAYPPPFLLLIAPIALLPFPIAALVWIAASVLALTLAVRRCLPGKLALVMAFPPVFICGMLGQNGLLFAALGIVAFGLLGTRPFVAGLILGLFAMKPQLALLLPVALIAGREWRAVAGAACSVLLLTAISFAFLGGPAWQGFLAMMQGFGEVAAQGQTGWQRLASPFAALRIVGAPTIVAAAAHLMIAVFAAASVWRIWRNPALNDTRAPVFAAATLLASPYLYMHDQVLLVLAIAWAAGEGMDEWKLAAIYALSLACVAQMAWPEIGINLLPLVPLAVLAAIIQRVRDCGDTKNWSGKEDSNLRPLPPEDSALPG